MPRRGAEPKPPWTAVPAAMKAEVARILGSPVARAERVYGGYAPSATYRLLLADGRRAFFKGVYPTDSGAKWDLDREEEIYRGALEYMRPWAPDFYGSTRADGWHGILLEDLGPQNSLPWTAAKARRAARSYAEFHKNTYGRKLPRWLSRVEHRDFSAFWDRLAGSGELDRTAALAGARAEEAAEWLDVALPVLRETARALAHARPPFALMHFDTRSDNVWLHADLLRMADWNWASVGPPEFELAAFAQSIAAEGGPAPERVEAWYADVLPLDDDALDASIAGIAGYFADRAWREPIPGLPRIRLVQRKQLRASLAWAARRLDLPDPKWLGAVPVRA
ncbi:MAG TPA: hypothetical protein VFM93_04165 [Candidatus Limnocylindria bacterium]|nr:hypothetical protein [Candidatus Limnocylindria bacterium]